MLIFTAVSLLTMLAFWLAFAILVGVFASIRRGRCGPCWFVLALVISPLLAGILVAILRERFEPPSRISQFAAVAVVGLGLLWVTGFVRPSDFGFAIGAPQLVSAPDANARCLVHGSGGCEKYAK